MWIIWSLLLWIDSAIYGLVAVIYEVFLIVASATFMSEDIAASITSSIYLVIGVVALFMIAYSILLKIVSMDDKKMDGADIVKRLVISFVAVLLVPFGFSFMYELQTSIVTTNIIPRIILYNDDDKNVNDNGSFVVDTETNGEVYGEHFLSWTVLNAFLYPIDEESGQPLTGSDRDNSPISNKGTVKNFGELESSVLSGNYMHISETAGEVGENIHYTAILSTIAGIAVLYLIGIFAIDLGIRAVKLAFLQLIAPIPIFMSILPGSRESLSTWGKKTLAVYFEVFTRIGIMSVVMFLLSMIVPNIGDFIGVDGVSVVTGLIANVIVIIGFLAFMNMAPKFISEATGIKSEGMSLGWKREALTESGQLLGKSIGRGTNILGSSYNAAKNVNKETKGQGFRRGTSTAKAAVSGMMKGISSSGDVKSISDGFATRNKNASKVLNTFNRHERERAERESLQAQGKSVEFLAPGAARDYYVAFKKMTGSEYNLKALEDKKNYAEKAIKSFKDYKGDVEMVKGAVEVQNSETLAKRAGASRNLAELSMLSEQIEEGGLKAASELQLNSIFDLGATEKDIYGKDILDKDGNTKKLFSKNNLDKRIGAFQESLKDEFGNIKPMNENQLLTYKALMKEAVTFVNKNTEDILGVHLATEEGLKKLSEEEGLNLTIGGGAGAVARAAHKKIKIAKEEINGGSKVHNTINQEYLANSPIKQTIEDINTTDFSSVFTNIKNATDSYQDALNEINYEITREKTRYEQKKDE